MALRLRRGTDAERLLITPAQGELIYTTDTRKLYIGDGTTVGGRIVEGSGSPDLANLADVDVAGVLDGQLLAYNSSTQKWEAINAGDGVVEGSNYKINIVGADSSIMIDTDTLQVNATIINGNVFGTLTGDVQGSVFSDDSGILVDAVAGRIVGSVNNDTVITQAITINNVLSNNSPILVRGVVSGTDASNLEYSSSRGTLAAPTVLSAGDGIVDIVASGYDGTAYTPTALIKMGPDKYTTAIGTGVMPGRILFFTFDETGAISANNAMVFNRFGNLGIKTDSPAQALDVNGNAVVRGFTQFGTFTYLERDALTPAAGMVIWNSDSTQFEGFDGTNWINLVDGVASVAP